MRPFLLRTVLHEVLPFIIVIVVIVVRLPVVVVVVVVVGSGRFGRVSGTRKYHGKVEAYASIASSIFIRLSLRY